MALICCLVGFVVLVFRVLTLMLGWMFVAWLFVLVCWFGC